MSVTSKRVGSILLPAPMEQMMGTPASLQMCIRDRPYAVRLQEADGPLALDALSEGWPAGAVLRPFATRHRVPLSLIHILPTAS